jgi:hypothetical protein
MSLDTDNESVQHYRTKYLIADMAKANGGVFLVTNEVADGRFNTRVLDVSGTDPVVEHKYHGMIFDVAFVDRSPFRLVVAAIEVVKTNGITHKKLMKIVKCGVLCITVKADERLWRTDDHRIEAMSIIAPSTATIRLAPLPPGGFVKPHTCALP